MTTNVLPLPGRYIRRRWTDRFIEQVGDSGQPLGGGDQRMGIISVLAQIMMSRNISGKSD